MLFSRHSVQGVRKDCVQRDANQHEADLADAGQRSAPVTTALVLSGGASLGAIQVGMLKALAARAIRPDLIVGTSVGAINGAFLAARPFDSDTVDELAELWLGISRGRVFPIEPLTGLLGFLGARKNLVPATPLRRLVKRHVDFDRLEDLPTPLHVVACDVMTGQEVRLGSGPLVDAVMASAAIPGVFPPVDWGDRLLIDGGVLNNTPIAHALDLGADEVFVLSANAACELDAPPRGALGMVVQATALMVAHRFTDEAAALAGRSDVVVVPAPCPVRVSPIDFRHTRDLIERSEVSANEFLAGRDADVVALHADRSSVA
jgi:NTE family protein